ncbi:hypothetical protein DAEQUDRAFT_516822 [Daedalea quercina L-15889]|uniref:Uncharacterized protein n=1 Tax=Daedalea quercina L-15889 TaxID=1314783 RepID=A0A165MFZ8_9APHY|nr:hypothetical protein DAEQUDRAFT_516822 [Daedalea quercina L-15889]
MSPPLSKLRASSWRQNTHPERSTSDYNNGHVHMSTSTTLRFEILQRNYQGIRALLSPFGRQVSSAERQFFHFSPWRYSQAGSPWRNTGEVNLYAHRGFSTVKLMASRGQRAHGCQTLASNQMQATTDFEWHCFAGVSFIIAYGGNGLTMTFYIE